MDMFNKKKVMKESHELSFNDIDFAVDTPIITGAYNIFAVYNAIVIALSLYDQSVKKHKEIPYMKQYIPIMSRLLIDLSKYIDVCKLKSDL